MDSVITFIGYIINLTLLGAFALFCFKFLQAKKNSNQKNQIQNLNAKLSMLRMTLKAKIKSKSYKYRALFKTGVTSGDPIDLALNELLTLSLENGDDLQRYFDISKRINSLLVTENTHEALLNKKDPSINTKEIVQVGKEDFMGTDFKSEIAILRLIKEMVEVTEIINKRIDYFNSVYPKLPIARLNSLNFPSLMEVNRVFMREKVDSNEPVEAA